MSKSIDLSVVIVSYNTSSLTRKCVESVLSSGKNINLEVVVVDNFSSDDSVTVIKKLATAHRQVRLVESKENAGFAAGNNLGIQNSSGRYVLFLNSDTVVGGGVLAKSLAWMEGHPEFGVFSWALRNPDGSLQGTGGYFPTLVRVFSWMTIQDIPYIDSMIKPFHPMKDKSFVSAESFYGKAQELDWVTGAFMLVRREAIEDVGEWDTSYFMYTEEVDYCYRIKEKGWKVYYNPEESITHIGGASNQSKESAVLYEFRGVKRFYKKHYPKWQYPVLRFLLKVGALWRIVVMGALEGKKGAYVYARAFISA